MATQDEIKGKQKTYREIYQLYRENLKGDINRLDELKEGDVIYDKFQRFGQEMWEDLNKIWDFTVNDESKREEQIAETFNHIIDVTPELLKILKAGKDENRLNEDDFLKVIMASKPNEVVQFSAKAAVKEVKAWKDLIRARIDFDPFVEDESNPLFTFIESQPPENDRGAFKYKVINYFSFKKVPPFKFDEHGVPLFSTEGRGTVDVSTLDQKGVSHQAAATATQIQSVGFEADQVLRHFAVEQLFAIDNEDKIAKLAEYMVKDPMKYLELKEKLFKTRAQWEEDNGLTSKTTDSQRDFIRKRTDKNPDIFSGEKVGTMMYAPEIPKATSEKLNTLAYEIALNITRSGEGLDDKKAEVYKALSALILEAEIGEFATSDEVQRDITSKVAANISLNSKSMEDYRKWETEKYETSLKYTRDFFENNNLKKIYTFEKMALGLKTFKVDETNPEDSGYTHHLINALSKTKSNEDMAVIATLFVHKMGVSLDKLKQVVEDEKLTTKIHEGGAGIRAINLNVRANEQKHRADIAEAKQETLELENRKLEAEAEERDRADKWADTLSDEEYDKLIGRRADSKKILEEYRKSLSNQLLDKVDEAFDSENTTKQIQRPIPSR